MLIYDVQNLFVPEENRRGIWREKEYNLKFLKYVLFITIFFTVKLREFYCTNESQDIYHSSRKQRGMFRSQIWSR